MKNLLIITFFLAALFARAELNGWDICTNVYGTNTLFPASEKIYPESLHSMTNWTACPTNWNWTTNCVIVIGVCSFLNIHEAFIQEDGTNYCLSVGQSTNGITLLAINSPNDIEFENGGNFEKLAVSDNWTMLPTNHNLENLVMEPTNVFINGIDATPESPDPNWTTLPTNDFDTNEVAQYEDKILEASNELSQMIEEGHITNFN